jgi:Fe2+ transport system protein FeoA
MKTLLHRAAARKHLVTSKNDCPPVRAELIRSDTCAAVGISVRGTSPVLALCRSLLSAGLNPDSSLEVFRNGILAVRVRSIREGAALEISAKGVGFTVRSSCGVVA